MIAVLTTPRPGGVRYVDATLAQITAERPAAPCVLVSDGPWSGELPAGWELAEAPKASHAAAFRRMCGIARARRARWLLALEDDVRIARGAIRYIESFPIPRRCGLVQFCNDLMAPHAPLGLFTGPAGVVRLLQALKIGRALLELLGGPPTHHDPEIDLANVMRPRALQIGLHVPDLVRHDGFVSAIAARAPRQGTNWIGDDATVDLSGARALYGRRALIARATASCPPPRAAAGSTAPR